MDAQRRRKALGLATWLPAYRSEWVAADLVAGLTTSAVVIPMAMAYAAIAGLPLVVGLYTALVPLVVYAVMGTSRPMSVSTTSTIAILSGAALGQVAAGDEPARLLAACATLSALVGASLLLAGVLRLGVVANLISDPVLTGFKAGVGLIIVVDQIPKLLGIQIHKLGFFRDIGSIVEQAPQASSPTLIVALAMLALMLGLRRLLPRAPAPLVTVVVGIAAAALAGLEQRGIALVGTVQAGLPGFVLPDLSLVQQLWPAALGIALMSFVETAAVGRAFIRKGDPTPDANRELVATGAANLAGGLFHAMPAGGGTSQTAVNFGAGARSPISGVVTAAMVAAALLFLAPLFALLPHATLAAVIVCASAGLCSPREFLAIRRVRTMEFHWALAAVAGVLVLGTLQGVVVAVIVSLLALMIHGSRYPVLLLLRKPGTAVFRPQSPEHPEDEHIPGLLLLRPEGGIYFANVPRLREEMRAFRERYDPRVLAIDMSAVPNLEFTALRSLVEQEERLREVGVELWLVALNPDVLAVVRRSGLEQRLGHGRMFFTVEQAVEAFQVSAARVEAGTSK